jgi:sugar/nucleoside kinase (ribokinase family)
MGTYDVICIGDAKIDAFLVFSDKDGAGKCRLDENTNELCFKHGEKIPVDRTYFSVGGNAANVSVGLSRLGVKSTIAAEIGDDEFSLKIINTLAVEGVERGFLKQDQSRESSFSVAITYKEDRTLFSEHIDRAHDFNYEHAESKWIYLTSLGNEWTNAYQKAINYCLENQVQMAFNPGTLQLREKSHIIENALQATGVLFVNKEEAEKLIYGYSNEYRNDDIQQILTNLKSLGPKTVVLTDGENGSFALDENDNFYQQDHAPAEVVELTGAGDAFSTGFLAGRVYGLELQECMKWGNFNSASVIEKMGSQEGLLKKEEMEEKING